MNKTLTFPFLVFRKAIAKKMCGAEKALVEFTKIIKAIAFSLFDLFQSLSKPSRIQEILP